MKKQLLFYLFISTIYYCFAQYKIEGIVQNEKGNPIANADIFLDNGIPITSNSRGKFFFLDIKNGQHQLSIFHDEHEPKHVGITVDNQDVTTIITLKKTKIIELDGAEIFVQKDTIFNSTDLSDVDTENTAIYAGKTSTVVSPDDITTNKGTNNARQNFARVSLTIWENDGAGIQLGIGGRGLSPNRTSNFNTRQNGYDISADALGYPDAYYNPPFEAVERIEIVRGAASLQYGTQFGGMVNFQLKEGNEKTPLEIVSRQTGGSFGLFNSFNSVGGKTGKLNYYTFYLYKRGDGWRPNSDFTYHNAYAHMDYDITDKLNIGVDYTHMNYLAHQAGGLTDEQFLENPRQSFRDRNWFRINWDLATLHIRYKLGNKNKTFLNSRTFGLLANRSALGFLGSLIRVEDIYRDLIVGDYQNIGNETRFLHKYQIKKQDAAFLAGFRAYRGYTISQQGDADSTANTDFNFLEKGMPNQSEYKTPSENFSLFAENLFHITDKLTITPGVRLEYIHTVSNGFYNQVTTDKAGNLISSTVEENNKEKTRLIPLYGVGASYKLSDSLETVKNEIYANISRNYRGLTFSDLRIVNGSLDIDENLQDETGYTADIGIKGQYKNLVKYSFTYFYLWYNDKIGVIINNKNARSLRTNVGNAQMTGLESLVEMNLLPLFGQDSSRNQLLAFVNTTYTHTQYISTENTAIDGREIEDAPSWLIRTGLSFERKKFKIAYQYAYTHEHFTDATNAESFPDATKGLIPSYFVMDLSASYELNSTFKLEGSINNLTNNEYYTRRASGYPGPGIIPSDGRSFNLTLEAKFKAKQKKKP
ncbi:MAG: TonB-dependent receptor [Cytophagales bacterium]|nr:TonB-dependent receptor [Cytophagales bacterium]